MFYFRIVLLYLLVVNVLGYTAPYYDLEKAEQLFDDFIEKYERKYESAEEYSKRFEIFKANLKNLNEWNHKYKLNDGGYVVTQFSDQDSYRSCIDTSGRHNRTTVEVKREFIVNAPAEIDYRNQNLVTGVKDQGPCGSCYVFATIGNIEGMYAKATNNLISLSEQQGLDCDNVSEGCVGGHEINVVNALVNQGGSMAEEDYPYVAAKGACHTDSSKIKVKVVGGNVMPTPDVETLKGALYQNGAPLAISLFASPSLHNTRTTDVINPHDCHNEQPNHAVLLVGYKMGDQGKNYWIIKNSWGTGPGDNGYFYFDMECRCSIGAGGATNAQVG